MGVDAAGETVVAISPVQAASALSLIRKSASSTRLQTQNGKPCSAGLDLAVFLISRRSGGVDVLGHPPVYLCRAPHGGVTRARNPRGPGWVRVVSAVAVTFEGRSRLS
ncbi:hypothetical protein AQJ30_04125 [Streptomyces longwoodensis]|uniref:Uncharacterized protein n=1 Tax=Streptomyces longwoodensis TaxID=68231 RepID=A0A101R3N1_9ACTN|nr:hypothetical protein AQJ30_04125 [Streptomyces longwoodensis]